MACSYVHLLLSPSAPLLPFSQGTLAPGTWLMSLLPCETAGSALRAGAVYQSLGPSLPKA